MDKISDDFENLRAELGQLKKIYNPENENLHFAALKLADTELYSKLLSLAQIGLATVRRHRDYFLKPSLYDDGMFWYNIFLMVSSAALRVQNDKNQKNISADIVKKLVEVLVDISEFSTVHYGDIVKRNHEALGNTLLTFYSKKLINLAQKRSREIASQRATEFVDWTLKRVNKIRAEEKG